MSLDTLSDSELRTKLSEYGYPVGPVTQTTRKILIKKLKNLMESRGSAGSRHSMAARYSSDDTDEDSVAKEKKKKKATLSSRRQTLANPMPPPSSTLTTSVTVPKSPMKKRMSSRHTPTPDPEPVIVDKTSTNSAVQTKRTFTKIPKASSVPNDGLETGSDSDAIEEVEIVPSPVIKSSLSTTKPLDSRVQDERPPRFGCIPKTYESNRVSSVHETFETTKKTSREVKDDNYSVNLPKPISSSSILKNDVYDKDTTKKDDILANIETPYLSEFTRRLSSSRTSINLPSVSKSPILTGSKYRHSILGSTGDSKDTDTNGHFTSNLRSSYPSSSSMTYITPSLDKSRDFKKTYKSTPEIRDESKNNQNFISMVLVIVVALFFGVLAIVYMGLEGKTDSYPSLPADSDIPLCNMELNDQRPGVNCVLKENVDNVKLMLKRLHQRLMEKAVAVECKGSKEPSYLTDNDIVKMLVSDKVADFQVKEDLARAHLLIFRNPKWRISLIDFTEDPLQVLDTMENVFSTRLEGKLGMVITEPDLPIPCLVRKKLFTVFSFMLIAAFGVLLLIGSRKLFLMYIQHKKDAEREVFNLVSEIISMVELHHQNITTSSPGSNQQSYLAINHVRDNIILPKDRKKKSSIWEKAVKFLDENESRIRREVQQVAGEEFHVWRWLPSNTSLSNSFGSSSGKLSKVWQGNAFETMEGSMNNLFCSPTPCLKIRHMFDPDVEFGDDWETKVKDAILDKCGEAVKILHIKVDRGSREGCVYTKCMSQEHAGKAYRSLHGCWFDGKLVTVKYLRLERYLERFPEAVHFTTPLKPSNNQRLSMQGQNWVNPSEAY